MKKLIKTSLGIFMFIAISSNVANAINLNSIVGSSLSQMKVLETPSTIINNTSYIETAIQMYYSATEKMPTSIDDIKGDFLYKIPKLGDDSWEVKCFEDDKNCIIGIESGNVTSNLCEDISQELGKAFDVNWTCQEGHILYDFNL